MDVNVMVIRIMSYIVAECEYERMIDQSCRGIDTSMSYDNFFLWNKACLEELSYEDLSWVWGLCKRLRLNREIILMMDLEDCGLWTASSIFYDTNKKLVIVHPR